MNTRRLGFVKRATCSRATRIRWQASHPIRSKQGSTTDLHHALESMTTLLKQSTLRTDQRFQRLCSLLETLPPWTEWSSKDDALLAPAVGEFLAHDFSSRPASTQPEDRKLDVAVPEEMLANSLIQLNGNCLYVREVDLERRDGAFYSMYLFWLRASSPPDDDQAHVLDENGRWIRDDVLRQRLKDGFVIHIPTVATATGCLPTKHARESVVFHTHPSSPGGSCQRGE